VGDRPNRRNKSVFLNSSSLVWTLPKASKAGLFYACGELNIDQGQNYTLILDWLNRKGTGHRSFKQIWH